MHPSGARLLAAQPHGAPALLLQDVDRNMAAVKHIVESHVGPQAGMEDRYMLAFTAVRPAAAQGVPAAAP